MLRTALLWTLFATDLTLVRSTKYGRTKITSSSVSQLSLSHSPAAVVFLPGAKLKFRNFRHFVPCFNRCHQESYLHFTCGCSVLCVITDTEDMCSYRQNKVKNERR